MRGRSSRRKPVNFVNLGKAPPVFAKADDPNRMLPIVFGRIIS